MQKILSFSAEEILKIDKKFPEKLFSYKNFDLELKKLRKWHPDVNSHPKANDVFVHIMILAKEAKLRIKTNTWKGASSLKYTTKEGKIFKFSYRKFNTFELGKMYIGFKYIMYVIDNNNVDLYKNGIESIKNIRYPSTELKAEFQELLPKIIQNKETDIGHVLIIEKPEGAFLLQDLLDSLPDNILPPKHTAWVISSLYNIAMFLDHVSITHNSILTSTVFVDPKKHACYLLGGWWYSVRTNNKLKAMPSELIKILPKSLLVDKLAKTKYDRQSIKSVAIKCLGDETLIGSKLLYCNIPKPMLSWLRASSNSDALKEYSGWGKTLEHSYGERKFTEFNYDINQIY